MTSHSLFAGLIATILVGCSQPAGQTGARATTPIAATATATATATSLDALYELGDQLARTICSGTPPSTEEVANPHVSGQTDRIDTRECATGSSTLYHGATTSNPEGFAIALSIRQADAGLPKVIDVGRPIEPAITALGVPTESSADRVIYGLGEERIDTLTLHHAAGRIVSVSWSWQID